MSYNITEEGITDEQAGEIGRQAVRMAGVVLLGLGLTAAVAAQLARERLGGWAGYYCPEVGCTDTNGPVRRNGVLFKGDVLTCPDVLVFKSDITLGSSKELVPGTCDVKLDPTPVPDVAVTPTS